MEPPTEVQRLAEELKGFLIDHMLRSARVFTGAWIIEVREASIVEPEYPDLVTEIKEFDL
jgi:hypothetical protein